MPICPLKTTPTYVYDHMICHRGVKFHNPPKWLQSALTNIASVAAQLAPAQFHVKHLA